MNPSFSNQSREVSDLERRAGETPDLHESGPPIDITVDNAPPPAPQFQSMTMQPQPESAVPTQSVAATSVTQAEKESGFDNELILYNHSALFYWWPVWAFGYLFALLTYLQGQAVTVGGEKVLVYPGNNLGVFFFLIVFLVILITNVAVRGIASVLVIVTAILIVVTLAYFGVWDQILSWFANLHIHLDFGAYFWFSTLMLLVWTVTVFVFDRFVYWRIRPGQITREYVLGAAARSYDTENMVLEKYREDIFRHWVLGLGSGDLVIRPYGPAREEIRVPNVLFIDSKLQTIQWLIATQLQSFGRVAVK